MESLLVRILGGVIVTLGMAYSFYRFGWLSCIVVAIVIPGVIVANGFSAEVLSFVSPFILGIVGGYTYRKKKSFAFYIAIASITLTLLSAAQFFYKTEVEQIDVLGLEKIGTERMMDQLGVPPEIKQKVIADWFEGIGRDILLFQFFVDGFIIAAILFLCMRIIFRRIQAEIVQGLEYFRVMDHAIFALIAGWSAVLLLDKESFSVLFILGLNLALITSMFYMIQALGVIKFMLVKKGLPVYILPLSLVVLFFGGILVVGFIMVMLVGLGTLDFWADFRKLKTKTT